MQNIIPIFLNNKPISYDDLIKIFKNCAIIGSARIENETIYFILEEDISKFRFDDFAIQERTWNKIHYKKALIIL